MAFRRFFNRKLKWEIVAPSSGGGGGGLSLVVANTFPPMSSDGMTSSINTAGANLIIVAMSNYNVTTLTDSVGNNYSVPAVTAGRANGSNYAIYYASGPGVGSANHTFTVVGGNYFNITIYAFSGANVSPLGGFNSNVVNTIPSTTFQPGSVTPTDGSVIVTMAGDLFAATSGTTLTAPGVTFTYSDIDWGGGSVGSTQGYAIQAVGAAINPTYSNSALAGGGLAGVIAWFHP